MTGELQFHLERQIEENVAAAMAPEEARYAARRAIGGLEQIKEDCRDTLHRRCPDAWNPSPNCVACREENDGANNWCPARI